MTIWRSFFSQFFATKFRQNVLILSSGNIIVQAIAILSYPILTRLYPDEVFGEYALFNGVAILLTFIITLRYEVAIPLPRRDSHAELLKKSTLFIALGFTLIAAVIAILMQWLNVYPPLNHVLIFIPLVALASSLLQVYRFWYLRIDGLISFFKYLISYRALYSIIAIGLPFTIIKTTNGLITAISASSLVIVIIVFLTHKPDFTKLFNFKKARILLNEHYRFPRYSLPSFIISHVTNQIPLFLIAYYFDEGTVGQYSVAYGLLFLPQSMLIGRISEALYQSFRHQPLSELKVIIYKIWRRIILIMLIPCITLFLFGSFIFEVLLGMNWTMAGQISEHFAIIIFFGSVVSSTSSVIQIFNLQKIGFFLSFSRLCYISVAFILAGVLDDLFIGIKIMVIMTSISDVIFTLFMFRKINRM